MAVVDRPEFVIAARDATKAAFDSVKRGFGDLQRAAVSARGAVVGLGGLLSAGAFAGFIRGGVESVAALDDLSEKTSLSVETLSQLQRVATIGGHSLENVATAAGKFARNVAEAIGGNKQLIKSFEDVGITLEQLKSQRVDELYVTFARNIANAENATFGLAQATKLAGKSAAEQLPFYKDLASEGLKAATVSAKQAQSAEDLQKAMKRLNVEFDVMIKLPIVKAILDISDALGVASTKAIALGDRLKLAFSGNVNIGRFAELAKREAEIIKEIEAVPQRTFGQRLLEGPDTGRINALKEELAFIRAQKGEVERLVKLRDEISTKPPEIAKVVIPPPSDEGANAAAEAAKRARLSLIEAQGKAVTDAEKRHAEVNLSLLERFYGQGLIEEKAYWETRQQIQAAGINTSIKAVEEEITARENALKKLPKGSAEALTLEKELVDARSRRAALEDDLANQTRLNFLDSVRAAEQYKDALKDVEIQLLELQGKEKEAAALQFEQQTRALRLRLEANRDTAGLQQLEALRAGREAQVAFNKARQDAVLVTEELAIQEERIQNSLRVGAISELEALRRTSDARAASLQSLEKMVEAVDAAAKSSGLKELELQAQRLRVQLEALKQESDLVAQKFNTIFESNLVDALGDIATGAKSAKEAFKDMVNSIVGDITRLAAQDVARQMFGGTGGGGGLGGIISQFLRGGGGGGGATMAQMIGQGMGAAGGMSYVPNDMFLKVHQGERIVPAAQNRSGNVIVNISMSGTTDRRTAEQQAVKIGTEVNSALRRTA